MEPMTVAIPLIFRFVQFHSKNERKATMWSVSPRNKNDSSNVPLLAQPSRVGAINGESAGVNPASSSASAKEGSPENPLLPKGGAQRSFLSRLFGGKGKAPAEIEGKGKKPAIENESVKSYGTVIPETAAPSSSSTASPISAQEGALTPQDFHRQLNALLDAANQEHPLGASSSQPVVERIADLFTRTQEISLDFSEIPEGKHSLVIHALEKFSAMPVRVGLRTLNLDFSKVQRPYGSSHSGEVDGESNEVMAIEAMAKAFSCLVPLSGKYPALEITLDLRNLYLGLSDPDPVLTWDLGVQFGTNEAFNAGRAFKRPEYFASGSKTRVFPLINSSDPEQTRLTALAEAIEKGANVTSLDLRNNMVPQAQAAELTDDQLAKEWKTGIAILAPVLGKSKLKILRLDLRATGPARIGHGEIIQQALMTVFKKLPASLTELDLRDNGLERSHIKTIRRHLPKSLQKLSLGEIKNVRDGNDKEMKALKKARPSLEIEYSVDGGSRQPPAPAHS